MVKQDKKDPPKTDKTPAGMKEFTSAKGKFSVLMPGTPQETELPSPDPQVGKIIAYIVQKPNQTFIVLCMDFKEDVGKMPIDKVLSDFGMAFTKSMPGSKISKETKITLGKYEGRQWQLEVQGKTVPLRVYLVGQRIYQLLAMVPPDEAPDILQFVQIAEIGPHHFLAAAGGAVFSPG